MARRRAGSRLRAAASVAVALVGLGIAGYLTVVHYAGAEPVCAIAHGCATVQKSAYAEPPGGRRAPRPHAPPAAAARPARRRRRPRGDRRRRRRDRLVLRRRRPKVKPVESSLLAGIPEHNGVLGDPKAKVTVTEFLDLQCPICAEASKQTLPTLINDYVRTGKVKLQARTLHFIGPDSARAARAAAAAQEQGKLWPFVEAFYAAQGAENSGYVTDGFLRDVAKAAGADPDKVVAGTSDAGHGEGRRRGRRSSA